MSFLLFKTSVLCTQFPVPYSLYPCTLYPVACSINYEESQRGVRSGEVEETEA